MNILFNFNFPSTVTKHDKVELQQWRIDIMPSLDLEIETHKVKLTKSIFSMKYLQKARKVSDNVNLYVKSFYFTYLYMIFSLDFGMVPTVWYFILFFILLYQDITVLKFQQWLMFCLHCIMKMFHFDTCRGIFIYHLNNWKSTMINRPFQTLIFKFYCFTEFIFLSGRQNASFSHNFQ